MRKRSLNGSQTSARSPLPQQRAAGDARARADAAARCSEIAAQLADVLEHRAVEARDVVPERAGGEFLADDHRAAIDQHRAGRHHAADAVIHRQAVVHAVARPRVHHAGEPMAPVHQPEMADDRGLRQAGGAGRVDVERAIVERSPPSRSEAARTSPESSAISAAMSGNARSPSPCDQTMASVARCGAALRNASSSSSRDDDVLRRDDVDAMGERSARRDWC